MIIELKYAEDGNLEAACREALKQIEEKKYAEGLSRRSAKKIMLIIKIEKRKRK